MATDDLSKYIETEVNKGIDDAIDTLRWCKRHRHERKAVDTLRLAQINLGYVALALDWEMEGSLSKAEVALSRIWWQPSQESIDIGWSAH